MIVAERVVNTRVDDDLSIDAGRHQLRFEVLRRIRSKESIEFGEVPLKQAATTSGRSQANTIARPPPMQKPTTPTLDDDTDGWASR